MGNLSQHDLDLWLPSTLPPSVLDIKIILRKLFDNPNILFRIIVYFPQSDKVKPLPSLYKLMPNDDIEKVVSTDQFEIAFSSTVNGEHDLLPCE